MLTKKSEKKEQTVKEGRKIKVYLQDIYIKGKFNIIDSGTIAIDRDTIQLADIKGIEARTSGTIATGVALTGLGAVVLGFGITAIREANKDDPRGTNSWTEPQGIIVTAIGAGMMTYGLGNLVGGMNYKAGKWRYSIR